jgi:hypothetical protein
LTNKRLSFAREVCRLTAEKCGRVTNAGNPRTNVRAFRRLSKEGFWIVPGQAMAVLGSLLLFERYQ